MKLVEVMACVDRVAKNGDNTTQHYKYAKAEDVYDAVRSELVKRSIRPKARHEETTFVARTAKSGGEMVICTIKGHLEFHDAETGEVEAYPSIGQGSDSLDKAAAKAVTAFMKQGIITAFLIPTGDDPENEKAEKSKPPPPAGLAAVKSQMAAPAVSGGPAPTHDRTLKYPFGTVKGEPIGSAKVTDKDLAYWEGRLQKDLTDPAQEKWAKSNTERLQHVHAEQFYRKRAASPSAPLQNGPRDDDGPPPPDDSDAPAN